MNDDDAPLLQASPNPVTRRLLEAGARERPRAGALAATAAALGVASLAEASALAHFAAQPGAATLPSAQPALIAPAGGAAKLASAAVALTTGKWLLIGALAGSVVSAGGFAVQSSAFSDTPRAFSDTPRTSRDTKRDEPRGAAIATPDSAIDVSPPPVPALGPGVSADAAAQRRAVARSERSLRAGPAPQDGSVASAPAESERAGLLARETLLIDAARRALGRGEVASASRTLDDYERTRVLGVLDREALILQIEVALRQGQTERARELASYFAARYPADAHVRRLRALTGVDQNTSD